MSSKVQHLYVHVPFCAAKCNYCAFYSEAGSAAKMAGYVDAVLIELELVLAALDTRGYRIQPQTIFFGGGTPSLLPVPVMRTLVEGLWRYIALECVREWTVECNPSTVTAEKARLFREFGVNRISMGVQAFDDKVLDALGRVHSVKAAVESYGKLRDAGFDSVNLDLMFGLPGQTLDQWRNTLDTAIALHPEHVSTYCLILEEDTHFWSMLQKDLIKPDEELEFKMYELAIETLSAAGYRQYEISNFAKAGHECAHNIAYWQSKDYLGLGPSACSTVGDRRWQNVADLDRYIAAMCSSGRPQPQSTVMYEETLTPELRAAERAAFGMRMNTGVPAELVRGRWDNQIAELLSAELVQWRNNHLAPTRRGILFADEVAAAFV